MSYHIFGVEPFLMATLLEPKAVKRALRKLIEVTLAFGNAQIDAGANALTLADHRTRTCALRTLTAISFRNSTRAPRTDSLSNRSPHLRQHG